MVALQAWGRLEGKLRHLGEARRLFAKAAELEPSNEYALQVRPGRTAWLVAMSRPFSFTVRRCRQHTDSPRAAAVCHKRGSTDSPVTGYLPAQAWAVAENQNGNSDQARALFQRATEAQPESVPAWQVPPSSPFRHARLHDHSQGCLAVAVCGVRVADSSAIWAGCRSCQTPLHRRGPSWRGMLGTPSGRVNCFTARYL